METSIEYQSFARQVVPTEAKRITMILGVVFATLLLFAVTICFHTKRSVTKEHGSWLRSLTEEELCFYYAKQVSVEEKEKQLCQVTDAMIFSDTIPSFVSYFFPVSSLLIFGFA